MALTAWCTAYFLLWGVLYPLRPARVFGISLQGSLPRQLRTSAGAMARVLAVEVVAAAGSMAASAGSTGMAAMRPLIESHLDTYLRVRLREKMPVIASFIGDSTILKLKESMIEEIDVLLPQVMAGYISSAVTVPAVQDKIRLALEATDEQKLETLAGPALRQARARIPWYCALTALAAGILLSALLYFFAC
ncbi:hypothetical protein GCM10023093_28100 [Nemorincola caseinilytica]|uniref:Type II secretion system (T2SS), protein F n=2 Tax=Nemorincola caseinilytica TaxID=2054315 RepID=A0ABP8NM09_9BACT